MHIDKTHSFTCINDGCRLWFRALSMEGAQHQTIRRQGLHTSQDQANPWMQSALKGMLLPGQPLLDRSQQLEVWAVLFKSWLNLASVGNIFYSQKATGLVTHKCKSLSWKLQAHFSECHVTFLVEGVQWWQLLLLLEMNQLDICFNSLQTRMLITRQCYHLLECNELMAPLGVKWIFI